MLHAERCVLCFGFALTLACVGRALPWLCLALHWLWPRIELALRWFSGPLTSKNRIGLGPILGSGPEVGGKIDPLGG